MITKPGTYQSDNPCHRLYLFLGNNKAILRRVERSDGEVYFDVLGDLEPVALQLVEADGGFPVPIVGENGDKLFFANLERFDLPPLLADAGLEALAIDAIASPQAPFHLSPELAKDIRTIRLHAIRIPYLRFKETDYIYRFRTEKQRNRQVYHIDESSQSLYHSELCEAIKAVKRSKERSASSPASLDFGAVEFLLPSHFGFCLGVQNAIERAYETIASNPGRRVFMLSELIHNPFVNEDLKKRGLLYLQSDKGEAVMDPESCKPYWDSLSDQDIVVIPAFGARDEDKVKLIEKGLPLNAYDATCMLVEKVWKAAKRFGEQGHTVVIHGKAEHEETKATFSNTVKYAPSIIVRDMGEAERLASVIVATDSAERRKLFEPFESTCNQNFDTDRDLSKLAIVNQTTLLRNETLRIIERLEEALRERYGSAHIEEHMAMSSKGDTLCYATQVNQDALSAAIQEKADVAIVVGGRNSSNTYQLYRLCQEVFGDKAFYIQSEANILSRDLIEHFVFPHDPSNPKQGRSEPRPFLPEGQRSLKILLTGGASCPDGLLQQVIAKINGYFDPSELRCIEDVITDLGG